MKIKQLLNEWEGRDDDIRLDIWNNEYIEFYQEIGELIDALPELFPNDPDVKDVYNHFTSEFNGYENAKISRDDFKTIKPVIDHTIENTRSLTSVIANLNKFKEQIESVEVYYDSNEINAKDIIDDTKEYSEDPYKYHGVSRKDFF